MLTFKTAWEFYKWVIAELATKYESASTHGRNLLVSLVIRTAEEYGMKFYATNGDFARLGLADEEAVKKMIRKALKNKAYRMRKASERYESSRAVASIPRFPSMPSAEELSLDPSDEESQHSSGFPLMPSAEELAEELTFSPGDHSLPSDSEDSYGPKKQKAKKKRKHRDMQPNSDAFSPGDHSLPSDSEDSYGPKKQKAKKDKAKKKRKHRDMQPNSDDYSKEEPDEPDCPFEHRDSSDDDYMPSQRY